MGVGECEFKFSPLYCVDVRNEWRYIYAPPTPSWHGLEQIYLTSIYAFIIIWKLSRSSFWNALFKGFFFWHNREKKSTRKIRQVRLPVCPHISLLLSSDRFARNLMTMGTPTIICRETPKLLQLGQEYRTLYINTYVSFTVARDLILHNSNAVQNSVFYIVLRLTRISKADTEHVVTFSLQQGYSNAPLYFALHMSPKFYRFWGPPCLSSRTRKTDGEKMSSVRNLENINL